VFFPQRLAVDIYDPVKRSLVMGRVRGKNTAPEVKVRKVLHQLGYRFRLHSAHLPGHPDIVLPRYRSVIFVHGCFWHQHPHCKRAKLPATRRGWWKNKLAANVERDKAVRDEVAQMGWRVEVIWECELREVDALARRLKGFIGS
jgi:DNA mismatch endonuclease (patch repair protein)